MLEAGASAGSALDELCCRYRSPLLAYAQRTTQSSHDAEDLVQSFFANLIEKRSLIRAEKRDETCRFRSWLITAFKNFRANRLRGDHAEIHGGTFHFVSIDAVDADGRHLHEPVDHDDALVLFERQWAETVLKNVADELQFHYTSKGQSERFEALKDLLWSKTEDETYAERALKLNMTKSHIAVYVHRLRMEQKKYLLAEVGRTVSDPSEIMAEIRHLISVLAKSSERGR